MKWRLGGLLLLIISATLGSQLLLAPKAQAAPVACPQPIATPYNTTHWCGYFLNRGDDSDGSIPNYGQVIMGGFPGWVVDTGSFIGFVTNTLRFGSAHDQVGAAFIILTMEGYNRPTAQVAAAYGGPIYNQWVADVTALGNANKIDFFYSHPFPCFILNSYHQGLYQDDAFYFEPPAAGRCSPIARRSSIVFRDPVTNAITYTLKRDCANPIGEVNPIPHAVWTLDDSLSPGLNAPGWGGVVQPGITYYLSPSVVNTSASTSGGFMMEVTNLNPSSGPAQPGVIANPPTTTGPYTSGAPTYTAGCFFGPQCWRWPYNGVPGGAASSQTNGLSFQISPATGDGASVCFNVVVDPSTNAGPAYVLKGPSTGFGYCFVVYHPRYPQVIGQSGDVHAGGGICGQVQNPTGKVTGNGSAGSYGEYVVSAAGLVTNYGSNNSGAGQGATLGKTGNYRTVCRPDLVATAQTYVNSGQATPVFGSPINLATLPPSVTGVYALQTANPTIFGNYNRKITLVAMSGMLTISGDVKLVGAPSVTGDQAPSLGIIARNGINISGAATQVDAYLFSDGTIDTCLQGATGACRNTLTVNGFLMAQSLSFQRLGPNNPVGVPVVGEKVNLTGQLYLNPPKLFDAASDVNLLQNQGERPPLN